MSISAQQQVWDEDTQAWVPWNPAADRAALIAALSSTVAEALADAVASLTTPDVTQPVSAASLPLPAGAASAAKQDAQTDALVFLENAITALSTAAGATGDSASANSHTGLLKAIKAALNGSLLVDSASGAQAQITTDNVYDAAGNLTTKVEDLPGGVTRSWTYTYDADDNLLTKTYVDS